MKKYFLWFALLSLSFAQLKVGDKAPPINLFRLDNNKYYHSKDEIGKNTIVLSFFATWCEPCKKEIPKLNTMIDTLDVDSISFYYVNVSNIIPPGEKNKSRETKKIINMFKEKLNITFPILLDKYALVYKSYKLQKMPTVVVIDKDGKISYFHQGYKPGDELELLDHLLKQK